MPKILEKDVLAMPKIWLKFSSTIIVSHGKNLMLCSSDINKKPLSLLQIMKNPPISVFKWFQHLKITRSHSLKKNQNQRNVDPNYFKNHNEPVIYKNEPIKNHQFNRQLFDFFNFLRIAIMYRTSPLIFREPQPCTLRTTLQTTLRTTAVYFYF
jgi:hypothetical protein